MVSVILGSSYLINNNTDGSSSVRFSHYFGFIFVLWEEVETHHPSLLTVIGQGVGGNSLLHTFFYCTQVCR